MNIISDVFGRTKEGETVERFLLCEGKYAVSVLTLGGIIQSLQVPDRNGTVTDIVLGFDTVADYENQECYIGALLGRCANRIEGDSVQLHGKMIHLNCNDRGICHLHGGNIGFNKRIWIPEIADGGLRLSYFSPDQEEGYPGNLKVIVTYRLHNKALSLHYHAECDQDTICNLSHHAYFNLAGHSSGEVGKQEIQVFSNRYMPLGTSGAPDGTISLVEQTPLDLRCMTPLERNWDSSFGQIVCAGGFDHNYLVDGVGMRRFAAAKSAVSGIQMQVSSDMPGMQLYTGNYLQDLPLGKGGAVYKKRNGFCIETQYPPNAVRFPNFTQAILKANEKYDHTTIFDFSVLHNAQREEMEK